MKYLVIYGYFEVDGFKLFDSKILLTEFLRREKETHKAAAGFFYKVFESLSIEEIEIEL